MTRVGHVLMLLCIALLCSAHIGSPDAWFDGNAGAYHVLVHVKAPPVVPGIAEVNINIDVPVDTVSAFVNKYDAIDGGPPPDVAQPVAGATGWYRTKLWVMDPGSNTVTVSVRGTRGAGRVVIPFVTVAARRLEFNGVLTAALGAAAAILVAGLLTLIGAAVRESVLPPGAAPDEARRKRARISMLRGALAIVAVVGGLGVWWKAEDSLFAQNLFKPLTTEARTETVDGGGNRLLLTITDSAWTHRNLERRRRIRGDNEFTTLVEDHQKLMHLFVVAENGATGFAHLHPTTVDSISFSALLPPLPAGRYHIYADVSHASGLAQTLTTSITLQSPPAGADVQPNVSLPDSDDAWMGNTLDSGATATLADGTKLLWLDAAAARVAGEQAGLRFQVTPPDGDTSSLEPYLGMLGHSVVTRDDGGVFIHLHPMGTVSMTAQTLLSHTKATTHDMEMSDTGAYPSSSDVAMNNRMLQFPYAFPSAGNYTIWVQLKRHGRVLTAAFHTTVTATGKR